MGVAGKYVEGPGAFFVLVPCPRHQDGRIILSHDLLFSVVPGTSRKTHTSPGSDHLR